MCTTFGELCPTVNGHPDSALLLPGDPSEMIPRPRCQANGPEFIVGMGIDMYIYIYIYTYTYIYTLILHIYIYMGKSLHCLHAGGNYGAFCDSGKHCDARISATSRNAGSCGTVNRARHVPNLTLCHTQPQKVPKPPPV